MTLRLACLLAPGPKTVEHARLAEAFGYDRVWLADSPALWQDIWARMAQVAEHTQRLQLGTAVLIPSLRHVVTQAAAIATIADIAPGRLTVGFATGFTGRHALGHKKRLPWAYVKRYVQQLRGLLHGDTVEVDGALCRLMPSAGYMPPLPIEVPIFLAVQGPLGRQVAKDVANGVIMPSLFVTGGFDTCVVTAHGTVLDEAEDVDSPRVRAAAGAGVALVYHTTYEARGDAVDALPNGRAWRESIERIPEATRHLALHFGHGIEMNEHDRAHVPMTDAKRLTFTGTPRELRARLADLEARGATEIVFGVRGPDMPRELRAFAALMQEP
jgi:5,10-methylenetetrahydromethanopterin reductase